MNKRVYVVVANDYPDAVFEAEVDAEAFCTEKKRETPRIHWRYYEFELRGFELKPKPSPNVAT